MDFSTNADDLAERLRRMRFHLADEGALPPQTPPEFIWKSEGGGLALSSCEGAM